ncbi:MAG: thioredoxin family protein [Candidatus Zipacnadales bacterium]
MRAYQVVGLVLVCGGIGFVVGIKVQEWRWSKVGNLKKVADCDDCGYLPKNMVQKKKASAIPTGSGLPCLVVFGTGECESCKKVLALLEELAPRLKGKLDVIKLDPGVFPGEAAKWRIRIIPTQILVSAEGKELWREEAFMPEEKFLAKLKQAGVQVAPAKNNSSL